MKKLLLLAAFFSWTFLQAQVRLRLTSLPAKYTPELDTLFVAGNFNNWNPRDTTYRFRSGIQGLEVLVPESPNPLQFKITRGSWASVEVAATGADIPNRSLVPVSGSTTEIQVADWTDTKGTHTATAQVRVLGSQIWLPSLKRFRRIWVCLPQGYEANPDKRYPVVYFHDGQNVFDAATSFAGEWRVDEALAQLENQNPSVAMIAVGIDNGGGERLAELTPFRHPTYGGGNAEKYASDLVTTIKPLIDSKFRTLPDAENTAIGGSSLGGVASLYMAFAFPEVYSKALVFSPSLWFSDSLRQYCLQRGPFPQSRLYWVCGTNEGDPDMVPDMNACYQDLLNDGMPAGQMSKLVVTGGTHSEGFWSGQVRNGLAWLFASTPTGVKKKNSEGQLARLYVQDGELRLQTQEKVSELICLDLLGRIRFRIQDPGEVLGTAPVSGLYFFQLKTTQGWQVRALKVP